MISVIIPVYNREKYIGEAIESVLIQNYKNLEIIIVDDGSTDNTRNEINKFWNSVNYFYQNNMGAPSARNFGISKSKGDIIAFLDSDDIWPIGRIVLLLKQFKNTDILMGMTQYFNGIIKNKLSDQLPILSLCTGLIKKNTFNKIGLFNEELLQCDDWDWIMRAREKNLKIKIISEVTLYYRRHKDNITNDKNEINKFQLKMFSKSIKRRKLSSNNISLNNINMKNKV